MGTMVLFEGTPLDAAIGFADKKVSEVSLSPPRTGLE